MEMPFGKYKGLPIRELPDSYLNWLHSLDYLTSWRLRAAVELAPAGTTIDVKATPGDPDSGPLIAAVKSPLQIALDFVPQ